MGVAAGTARNWHSQSAYSANDFRNCSSHNDFDRGCLRLEGAPLLTPKRPRDPNQLAKLIIDIVTGQKSDRDPTPEEQGKDPASSQLLRAFISQTPWGQKPYEGFRRRPL